MRQVRYIVQTTLIAGLCRRPDVLEILHLIRKDNFRKWISELWPIHYSMFLTLQSACDLKNLKIPARVSEFPPEFLNACLRRIKVSEAEFGRALTDHAGTLAVMKKTGCVWRLSCDVTSHLSLPCHVAVDVVTNNASYPR